MRCVDDRQLLELVESGLAPDEMAEVKDHLDGCDECRTLVADMVRASLAASLSGMSTVLPTMAVTEPAMDTPHNLMPVGARFSHYTIRGYLGAGAMGVVYLAWDDELHRRVALKLLRADIGLASETARRAVLREAQAMARLSSPHVAAIYEVGTVGEQVFIAMEHVDGVTLTRWLRGERRGWREILGVFTAAARGLAVAHRTGLVHRDFKPDNVLVGADGRVCVTDFGLARLTDDAPPRDDAPLDSAEPVSNRSRTGATVGTPAYMAPEQARHEVVDARTDEFAFCVALYEALGEVRPFAGSTLPARLQAIEAGQLTPPRRRVPRWIERVLKRGLAARLVDRFPSIDAIIVALTPAWWIRQPRWAAGLAMAILGAGALTAMIATGVPAFHRAAVPMCAPLADGAAEIFVDASAATGGSGTATCPLRTITAALALPPAPDHRTIHVAAGTYDRALGEHFPLMVRGDLAIDGAGQDATFVAGIGDYVRPAGSKNSMGAERGVTVVIGEHNRPTELSHLSIAPGEPDIGYAHNGIMCDRGNLGEYTGTAPPPPASTVLRDVVLGPNYYYGVVVAGSDDTGCNLRLVRTKVLHDHTGLWAVGCGSGDWSRAVAIDVEDSLFSGLRDAVGAGIGISTWDCTAWLSVTRTVFEDGDAGIVAVRHSEGPSFVFPDGPAYIVLEGNAFHDLSSAGITLRRAASIARMDDNSFSTMTAPRTAQAADRAASLRIDNDNESGASASIERARGNVFSVSDIGIEARSRFPLGGILDFGRPDDPGGNLLRCNATREGSAVAGHDLFIDAPDGGNARLLFSGNIWDHATPTRGEENGADISAQIALPGLDVSNSTTTKAECAARRP